MILVAFTRLRGYANASQSYVIRALLDLSTIFLIPIQGAFSALPAFEEYQRPLLFLSLLLQKSQILHTKRSAALSLWIS